MNDQDRLFLCSWQDIATLVNYSGKMFTCASIFCKYLVSQTRPNRRAARIAFVVLNAPRADRSALGLACMTSKVYKNLSVARAL